MNNNEMLAIFDREVRRECEWTRMEREEFPTLVRYTEMDNPKGGGFISWSALNENNVDAVIEEQIAHYRKINKELEWKFYTQDLPANLDDRLLAYGFTADDPEALMVAGMDDLPSDYWTMDVSAASRVTTPEGVDEIVRMESEVWTRDISGFARGMKYDLEHHPDHISVFAVWQDGRIVSAAWTHYLLSTSFATLWGGSTLKEYRKRGYYTALLAVRAREARERGFRFLQVDASPDSQPILAKHGFRCLGYSRSFTWKP
jgi:GNAT superfamily N-acetyltransferase